MVNVKVRPKGIDDGHLSQALVAGYRHVTI